MYTVRAIIQEMSELHSQAFPKLPQEAVTDWSGECSGLIELLMYYPSSLPTCIPTAKRNWRRVTLQAKLSEGTL